MDIYKIKFVGSPKRTQDQYTFYKAFKYSRNGSNHLLAIGEFIFLKLEDNQEPCIAEVQLIWTDATDNAYCTLRLYFLPEHTSQGRLSIHGEHEVVAASDKFSLLLSELVPRSLLVIPPDTLWASKGLVSPAAPPEALKTLQDDVVIQGFLDRNAGLDFGEVRKERRALQELQDASPGPNGTAEQASLSLQPGVLVLSYPRYCRYRSILKRLAGAGLHWLTSALILGLGGLLPAGGTHVLFCRDTFDHENLRDLPFNVEHLAPSLKPKHKKKRSGWGSASSGSSEDEAASSPEPYLNEEPPLDEQEFLQNLFKFMKLRNTPISRVPYLGFKKIDLYLFYKTAQKLGGYEKITCKRLWKRLYDEMGGDPRSTSAATCTRRHYERLLLPFERYLRRRNGQVIKSESPPSQPISTAIEESTKPHQHHHHHQQQHQQQFHPPQQQEAPARVKTPNSPAVPNNSQLPLPPPPLIKAKQLRPSPKSAGFMPSGIYPEVPPPTHGAVPSSPSLLKAHSFPSHPPSSNLGIRNNNLNHNKRPPSSADSNSQISALLSQLASNPEITLLPPRPSPVMHPPPLLKIPQVRPSHHIMAKPSPPPKATSLEVLDLSIKPRKQNNVAQSYSSSLEVTCLDLSKKPKTSSSITPISSSSSKNSIEVKCIPNGIANVTSPLVSDSSFPLIGKLAPPPNSRLYQPFQPYHSLYKPVGAP